MQIIGYPTIMFVSAKDGSILDYKGKRVLSDLINFVNKNIGSVNTEEKITNAEGDGSLKDEL